MGSPGRVADQVSQEVRSAHRSQDPDGELVEDADGGQDAAAQQSWMGLLSSLSDDQLLRYGEIARDQKQLEWNNAALQGLAIGGAVVLVAAIVAEIYAGWSWYYVGLTALIAGACANFPWQKHRMRSLWTRHIKAVEQERLRRAQMCGASRRDTETR